MHRLPEADDGSDVVAKVGPGLSWVPRRNAGKKKEKGKIWRAVSVKEESVTFPPEIMQGGSVHLFPKHGFAHRGGQCVALQKTEAHVQEAAR